MTATRTILLIGLSTLAFVGQANAQSGDHVSSVRSSAGVLLCVRRTRWRRAAARRYRPA